MNDEERRDPRIAATIEQLKKAAYFAELAAEALSSVEGQTERWERIRELVFALREERDALRDHCDGR